MTQAVDFSAMDHRSPDGFISRRDAELLQEGRSHVFRWRKFAQNNLDAAMVEMFPAALVHLFETRKFGGNYTIQIFGQLTDDKNGALFFALTPQHVVMHRIEWPVDSEESEFGPLNNCREITLGKYGSYNVAAAKEFCHFSLALMKGAVPPRVLTEPIFPGNTATKP